MVDELSSRFRRSIPVALGLDHIDLIINALDTAIPMHVRSWGSSAARPATLLGERARDLSVDALRNRIPKITEETGNRSTRFTHSWWRILYLRPTLLDGKNLDGALRVLCKAKGESEALFIARYNCIPRQGGAISSINERNI